MVKKLFLSLFFIIIGQICAAEVQCEMKDQYFCNLLLQKVNSAAYQTLAVKERWIQAANEICDECKKNAYKELELEVKAKNPAYDDQSEDQKLDVLIQTAERIFEKYYLEHINEIAKTLKTDDILDSSNEHYKFIANLAQQINLPGVPAVIARQSPILPIGAGMGIIFIDQEKFSAVPGTRFSCAHELIHIKYFDSYTQFVFDTYVLLLYKENNLTQLDYITYQEKERELVQKIGQEDDILGRTELAKKLSTLMIAIKEKKKYPLFYQAFEMRADIEAACTRPDFIDEGIEFCKFVMQDAEQYGVIDFKHPTPHDRIAYLQALKEQLVKNN